MSQESAPQSYNSDNNIEILYNIRLLKQMREELTKALSVFATLESVDKVKRDTRSIESSIQALELATKALEDKIAGRHITILDRLRLQFRTDSFLLYAVLLGIAVTLFLVIFEIPPLLLRYFRAFSPDFGKDFGWLGVSSAYAQTGDSSNPHKDIGIAQQAIIFIIPIAFIGSFLVLIFSEKEDARKLAADTIKTIVGFTIGVATNILK